jgi:hypothetical protein
LAQVGENHRIDLSPRILPASPCRKLKEDRTFDRLRR